MPVAEQVPVGAQTGNGSSTTFAFAYPVFDATDLVVSINGTVKILGVDYTLTGVGGASGSIVFTTAPASGATILHFRRSALERETNYLELGDLQAAVVNRDFDRIWLAIQELQNEIDGSLRLARPNTVPTMPAPEASKFIGWDDTATGLVNRDVVDLATVITYGTNTTEFFSGTGAQTVFALATDPGSVHNLDVSIGGVVQSAGSDFSLSGTTLTFNSAPPLGASNIAVRSGQALPVGTADWADVSGKPFADVRDFGAVGDGAADDTTAIQAALNTGLDVFVPGTSAYYRITSELTMQSDQHIFGEGAKSQIRQVTAAQNVLVAFGKHGAKASNLWLHANGEATSYLQNGGFLIRSSSNCVAQNLVVSNHLSGGVTIYNGNENTVEGCRFIDSPLADNVTGGSADVIVVYSSSRNIIRGNTCISGNATGITLQSIANGDVCDQNVVAGNVIKNMKAYGIIVYRNSDSPLDQSIRHCVVSDNSIENITGTNLNPAVMNYSFGAGIYLQGAEDAVCVGNTIRHSHSGAVTFAETLAPGAIGATNMTRCSIVGNTIEDAGMFGIDVGDPNTFGETDGGTVISGNTITRSTRSGINVRNRGSVNITGNVVSNNAGNSGIRVNNTTLKTGIVISANMIRNIVGTAGIDCAFVDGLAISGNLVDTATVHGIAVADSDKVSILSNQVRNQATRGIQIGAGCSNVSVRSNHISSTNTTGTVGITFTSNAVQSENFVSGCLTTFDGAGAPWRVLTVNSATPSVVNGIEFTTANTVATTLTNFSGGRDGQRISVVFTDANTSLDFTSSSLKGNGGVDRAMAAGDAIEAVYRAGASAWYVTVIDA